MTFADAITTIVNSSNVNAVKRTSWGGYVYRSDINETTGAYTLTFKNRSGTTYEYSYNGSTWTAPSTPAAIDAELLESLIANDWITGTAANFEAARSGQGVW